MTDNSSDETWAVVELMGHVRMAGRLSEVERFGGKLARLDVPVGEGFATEFFGHGSVYRIRPVSEEIARAVAEHNRPEPIHPWELPRALPAPRSETDAELVDDDDPDAFDDVYQGEDDNSPFDPPEF